MKYVFLLALCAAAILAACSGGGGSQSPALAPAPAITGTSIPTAGPASGTRGTISLVIPASKSAAATVRHAQFVSASAMSAVVAVNGASPASYDVSSTSAYCTTGSGGRTCSLPIGVPVGSASASVTLSLYDAAMGTGKFLGSGSGSTAIPANAMSFNVALDVSPVVSSVAMTLNFTLTGLPRISFGKAEQGTNAGIATLVYADPDGNVIPSTSTSTFLTPIALSVTDTSGTVSIAPASVTNAAQTVLVSYTGATTIGSSVTFNAKAGTATVGTLLSKTSGYQTEYALTGSGKEPYGIAVGADGNLWFAEVMNASVGSINPTTFTINEYPVPNSGSSPMPYFVAPGPAGDPHVWFTEPTNSGGANYGYIANISTIDQSTTAFYTGGNASNPLGLLAVGSNMWETLYGSNQLRVTNVTGTPSPSGPQTPPPGSDPNGMTVGPDGNVWVAGMGNGTILSYSTTYPYPMVLATSVPAGSGSHPAQLVSGPDGAIWFTEQLGNIGRITTAGVITEFTPPDGQPYPIANGSDGGIWFISNASPTTITRIDPTTHAFVSCTLQSTQASWGMVSGPDGNLWATDFLGNRIIRIQP